MTMACLLMLAIVLWILFQLSPPLAGLTAQNALTWAMLAIVATMTAAMLKLIPGVTPRVTSAVHYLSATLLLTPLVDILGARNPGHRAWPCFVVVPLIAVLQWPCVTQIISGRPDVPIEVPTPTVIGFLIVLTMGAGNYFGTAHTAACLFGTAGIVVYVLPVTEWMVWPNDYLTTVSAGLLLVAGLLVQRRLNSMRRTAHPNELWSDFRDTFGLVWAKRVMDRVNQFADREDWDIYMTLDGFQKRTRSGPGAVNPDRPIAALRWVLKRFADDSFLDRYAIESITSDVE